MTDEEMAEEYAKGLCKTCTVDTCRYNTLQTCAIKESLKQAYLAGLNEGKPKWHTDPNDLPPMIQDERHISERVWIHVKNWGTEEGHYDYRKKAWIIRCRIVNLDVLGWTKIPKFEE